MWCGVLVTATNGIPEKAAVNQQNSAGIVVAPATVGPLWGVSCVCNHNVGSEWPGAARGWAWGGGGGAGHAGNVGWEVGEVWEVGAQWGQCGYSV